MLIDSIIECNHLGKRYHKNWVLKDINLKISPGKITLLAGPSGAGKSTLINILSGVIPLSEGNFSLLGNSINMGFEKVKPFISCVWSEVSLFLNMSAANNLRFYSFLYGQDRRTVDNKIKEILNYFGVSHEYDKYVHNLSSGVQRKVDLCRAFMNNFEILLLDEPSVSLDNQTKKKLVKILGMYKELGKTILIVSHHASLYFDLIDDVIVLKKGMIIYNRSIDYLIKDSKEFKNSYILKTSNRLAANDILKNLDEVKDTYVSQKSLHVYLKENADLYSVINSLGKAEIRIKKIISKEPNLDKLIGDIINAH